MPTDDLPHIQRETARQDGVIRRCLRCGETFATDLFETYAAFLDRYQAYRDQHDECTATADCPKCHHARHLDRDCIRCTCDANSSEAVTELTGLMEGSL